MKKIDPKVAFIPVIIIFGLVVSIHYKKDKPIKDEVIYEVIEVEDIDSPIGTPTVTVDTFKELQEGNYTNNSIVVTKGFYYNNDGGGGQYRIVSNQGSKYQGVFLSNKQVAMLISNDGTASVKQFGAHGDGVSNDSNALNLALNSGMKTININEGSYKCNEQLVLQTDNVSIIGKNSELFTDNDYSSGDKEEFILIKSNNVKIKKVQILSKESKTYYKEQLRVIGSSNVEIDECIFIVPEISDNKSRVRTNIDLYSGWSNIEIKNCRLENYTFGPAGGCIWIRDLYNQGSRNLKFNNNECIKSSHDEILAVFLGTISDINITNNKFKTVEKSMDDPSVMNFTIGSNETVSLSNVKFEFNEVEVQSKMNVFYFGKVSNTSINNNSINYEKLSDQASYVFTTDFNNQPISIKNNTIQLKKSNFPISYLFNINSLIENNKILINTEIDSLCSNSNSVINSNNIVINNKIKNITFCLKEFKNNDVYINNTITHLCRLYNYSLNSNCIISNNTYNLNELASQSIKNILSIQDMKLNNNIVEFNNNNIILSTIRNDINMYFVNVILDNKGQEIDIIGNTTNFAFTTFIRDEDKNHLVDIKKTVVQKFNDL